ncbi:hypothetical protein CRENBAI_000030 [Crenichthys baileyi]|uniref:Uncharacterized protein n=1 Tax=Crenichthys baileyi TaxID=28760 RepID=A0AAV9SUN5_9TELE
MTHRVGCGFNINGSINIVIRSSCLRNKVCKGVSQHYHLCRCASSLMVLCTPQHVVVKLSNIRAGCSLQTTGYEIWISTTHCFQPVQT